MSGGRRTSAGRRVSGGRAGLGRAVVAGLLALTALLPAAPAVLAADVTFGRGTAAAAFGEGITFRIDVTVSAPLERAEILIGLPDALGPQVAEVAVPGPGSRTLTWTWDLGEDGYLVPNTRLSAVWRLTPAGGEPVLSPATTITYADARFDWQTVEGDIVRVHWYEGSAAFGRRALEIGETAVAETAALLGVTEDEPIDFFIYPDELPFREALGPGTRENVGGQAHADIRTLFALIAPGEIDAGWVGVVVPHELVHLVFDTAVDNPYRFPPRWLNEGLAVYLSQGYDASDRARVEDAVATDTLIPLAGLSGQFPTTFDRFALAYAESVAAVDHLVAEHGRDALIALVRSYRDGLTDDEAFTRALGRTLADFQAGWLTALGADEPVRVGPQPAPPGPVPPGWDSAAATPVPSATGDGAPTVPPTAAPSAGGPGGGGDSGAGGGLPAVLGVLVLGGALLAAAWLVRGRSRAR